MAIRLGAVVWLQALRPCRPNTPDKKRAHKMCVHVTCMYVRTHAVHNQHSHLRVISGVALVEGDDRWKVTLHQHNWWQLYCCCYGNLQNNNVFSVVKARATGSMRTPRYDHSVCFRVTYNYIMSCLCHVIDYIPLFNRARKTKASINMYCGAYLCLAFASWTP